MSDLNAQRRGPLEPVMDYRAPSRGYTCARPNSERQRSVDAARRQLTHCGECIKQIDAGEPDDTACDECRRALRYLQLAVGGQDFLRGALCDAGREGLLPARPGPRFNAGIKRNVMRFSE